MTNWGMLGLLSMFSSPILIQIHLEIRDCKNNLIDSDSRSSFLRDWSQSTSILNLRFSGIRKYDQASDTCLLCPFQRNSPESFYLEIDHSEISKVNKSWMTDHNQRSNNNLSTTSWSPKSFGIGNFYLIIEWRKIMLQWSYLVIKMLERTLNALNMEDGIS